MIVMRFGALSAGTKAYFIYRRSFVQTVTCHTFNQFQNLTLNVSALND